MPPYKYYVRLTSTDKRALRRLKRHAKTEARLAANRFDVQVQPQIALSQYLAVARLFR